MRITLDIDNSKEYKVRGKAVIMKCMFPDCRVRYRISSSGKGGHVEVLGAEVEEYMMYKIRTMMGDHDKRVAIDVSRHGDNGFRLPQQVLFDFKIVNGIIKRASEWRYIYYV